jgi:hypothetical protein
MRRDVSERVRLMTRTDILSRTSAEEAAARRQGSLLLNWFDIEPGAESAFDDWHNREHVIERMGVPGFRQGRRFEVVGEPRAAGHSYLVAYDASDIGVFESAGYAARLDNPTRLTTAAVPSLRSLTRTVYKVEARRGGGSGAYVRTVRLPSAKGEPIGASALRTTAEDLYAVSGVTSVILGSPDGRVTHYKDKTREGRATETLVHEDYPWIVIVEACRLTALDDASTLLDDAVARTVPAASPISDTYRLVFSMTTEQGAP